MFVHSIGFINAQTEKYEFEHITSEQGLSHNRTKCIIQDSRGFIWIGTNRGLNRYDGTRFKTYTCNQDTTSQTGEVINDIFEDREGNIWVGTSGSGLSIYNRALDNFKRYQSNPDDSTSLSHKHVKSIFQDMEGIVWIGTYGGGLNKFKPGSGTFSVYKQFPGQDDHFADRIYDLYEDNEGVFWIGTEAGLFIFDREKESFSPFEFNLDIPPMANVFQYIYQDENNILWFGSYYGLLRYDNTSDDITRIPLQGSPPPDEISDGVVECITGSGSGSDNFLWIGTRSSGIIKIDLEKNKIIRISQDTEEPFSLSGNFITDICLDNTGNLWIATWNSGLNKLNLNKSYFPQYRLTSEQDYFQYPASTFLMDKKGSLWVGARSGGLYKFDREMNIVGHFEPNFYVPYRTDSIITNYVNCLFEDSKGALWADFAALGLTVFDTINESFIPIYGIPNKDDTIPTRIWDIIEDVSGRIWIGDFVKGLFYKKKSDKISDPLRRVNHEILDRARIRDLFEDSNGNIWIGTLDDGLFFLPPENRVTMNFVQYQNRGIDSNGYYGTYINSICEDINGTIWITSSVGLNRFDPLSNKFEVFKQHKELFGDQIMKIFSDSKGHLWFNHYTYQLGRFDPYDSIQNPIKVFGTQDGLPFSDLSYRGLYQAKDGRIFIGSARGTHDGFFSFYPDSVYENIQIPVLTITDFKVRNRDYSLDSNITEKKNIILNYNENFFSFEFAALDYTNPGKNQYAYFLEGLEANWIYSGNRKFANYTGLSPGNYIFHVKGSNNDGYWNEAGTSISVIILPPPWKSWWAYLLYILFFLGILYVWRRYDLKRQRLKQQLELEQVEATKLKELDSLKSRFFANISHEFRTPLTLILGPLEKLRSKITDPESDQDLNIMQRNARRLQNLINQLLSLSKLESGKMKLQAREVNIVALVNGYVQSFESLAKQKGIDLIFNSEEEFIPQYIDKDKIEKILYNLLSNAFKFTPEGGRIEVTVSGQRSVVSLPDSIGQAGGQERSVNGKLTADRQLPTADLLENCTVISISDTGSGIARDQLPHIFDRFYQADDSFTRDQEGTGIGLALTKELVEIHHGKITAESQKDKGTIFSVYLPMGSRHLKPDEITDETSPPGNQDESPGLIPEVQFSDDNLTQESSIEHDELAVKDDKPYLLMVDDNADLRAYMRGYLDTAYYISEARDGEEGFDKAIEKIPDLVISDVMMPKMDGYQLCEKLKSDERTSHIPVILLTARASTESRIEGLETGADDFITKPFDAEELKIRINNLIDQRRKLKERFLNNAERIGLNELLQLPESGIGSMDQQFMQKALMIVHENISDPDFSVVAFASKMNMSRMQIYRKLLALSGQPANMFIRTLRLKKAAALLAGKSGNVTEVAYEVGFNNLSYFARCFKEQYGLSPSEFLSKNQQ